LPNIKWMKECGHLFSLCTDDTIFYIFINVYIRQLTPISGIKNTKVYVEKIIKILFNNDATGERFEILYFLFKKYKKKL